MNKEFVETPCGRIRVGSLIHIDKVYTKTNITNVFKDGIDHQAESLNGKTGTVETLTSNSASGTWGRLSLLLDKDQFTVIQY